MNTAIAAPQISIAKLRRLEAERTISIQRHPALPLLIHNYTPQCQYSRAWCDLSLMCRGLITDLEGNVVARPFPKFFNLSEHDAHESSGHTNGFRLPPINWRQNFTALKKYDGSLGILYADHGQLCLATRGSFVSEQAVRGTRIFRERGYGRSASVFDLDRFTYLFEIIYPENKIVIDYGAMQDVVLLDIIETATGRGMPYVDLAAEAKRIGCPAAERLEATADMLRELAFSEPNSEGYVVRFEDGSRIKIKFAEYVRLHKLVTGVSNKTIWEGLSEGRGVSELLDRVPDEFNAWVRQTVAELQANQQAVLAAAAEIFAEAKGRLGSASRKEYALEFVQRQPHAPLLFAMLDGKDCKPMAWKMVKPEFARPFFVDPDK